jgi:hypothetical protein
MKKTEEKKKNIFPLILLLSLVTLTLSQLVINSILTPLGSRLEALNREKEHLLEENREMSEEVAKSSSLKVIENLSEKKLNLSVIKTQTYIYIQDSTLVANN